MSQALSQFNSNIQSVQDLALLYDIGLKLQNIRDLLIPHENGILKKAQ
jgi:hypothetical protein